LDQNCTIKILFVLRENLLFCVRDDKKTCIDSSWIVYKIRFKGMQFYALLSFAKFC